MNHRISEMAEIAKNSVPHGVMAVDKWIEIYNQKFAELIIVKCANIVWDEAEKTMNKEINEVGYEILKHFGVEE